MVPQGPEKEALRGGGRRRRGPRAPSLLALIQASCSGHTCLGRGPRGQVPCRPFPRPVRSPGTAHDCRDHSQSSARPSPLERQRREGFGWVYFTHHFLLESGKGPGAWEMCPAGS